MASARAAKAGAAKAGAAVARESDPDAAGEVKAPERGAAAEAGGRQDRGAREADDAAAAVAPVRAAPRTDAA